MAETKQPFMVTTWFIAGVACIAVLVGGMYLSIVDPDNSVDNLDKPLLPPGGRIQVEGDAKVQLVFGQNRKDPGWVPVGTYQWEASTGGAAPVSGTPAITVKDKQVVTIACHGGVCAVR